MSLEWLRLPTGDVTEVGEAMLLSARLSIDLGLTVCLEAIRLLRIKIELSHIKTILNSEHRNCIIINTLNLTCCQFVTFTVKFYIYLNIIDLSIRSFGFRN